MKEHIWKVVLIWFRKYTFDWLSLNYLEKGQHGLDNTKRKLRVVVEGALDMERFMNFTMEN